MITCPKANESKLSWGQAAVTPCKSKGLVSNSFGRSYVLLPRLLTTMIFDVHAISGPLPFSRSELMPFLARDFVEVGDNSERFSHMLRAVRVFDEIRKPERYRIFIKRS